MITAIITTAVIVGALSYALRPGNSSDMIVKRPYNNRHNDASGARDYGLLETRPRRSSDSSANLPFA